MRKVDKLTNRVFGDFRVKPEHENRDNITYWRCLCKNCKSEKWISRSNLLKGNGVTCRKCKEKEYALKRKALCDCGAVIYKHDTNCKKCNSVKTLEMIERYILRVSTRTMHL